MTNHLAVLVENDFHDLEFWYPYYRLQEAGFEPLVVAPAAPRMYKGKYGTTVEATYDAGSLQGHPLLGVIIPGGWAPDKLRMSPDIVQLVKRVFENGGLVAGICHAGSLLVSADIVEGRQVTSYPSIRDDLAKAGVEWIDAPVVNSRGLVTSRRPTDLPFFMKEIIDFLSA